VVINVIYLSDMVCGNSENDFVLEATLKRVKENGQWIDIDRWMDGY